MLSPLVSEKTSARTSAASGLASLPPCGALAPGAPEAAQVARQERERERKRGRASTRPSGHFSIETGDYKQLKCQRTDCSA